MPAAANRRRRLAAGALADEKGMVECERHGDIVAVLPWPKPAAVDFLDTHASAKFSTLIGLPANWVDHGEG